MNNLRTYLIALIVAVVGAFLYDVLKLSIFGVIDYLILAFDFFEKSIYHEVSLGFREKYSLVILLGFVVAPIYVVEIIFLKNRKVKSQKKNSKKKTNLILVIMTLFFIYLLAFIFQITYVYNKISCFNHRYDIVAPYGEREDILMFKSRFSLVANREDYFNIMQDMNTILDDNGILNYERLNCKY